MKHCKKKMLQLNLEVSNLEKINQNKTIKKLQLTMKGGHE